MPPRISGPLQPWLQVLGVMRLLQRLHRQQPLDVINAHWIYPDGVAAVFMARRLGIPAVLTALGSDLNVYAHYRTRRRQILWALRQANAVTAVSPALIEGMQAMGIAGDKLHHIGNGVDARRFSRADSELVRARRQQLGLRADRRYIVFVGRLHPVKGLTYLLQAINLLRARGVADFGLILVGDGELRAEFERYIASHDLAETVRIVGEVPHGRVHEWLQACDIFCLPSLMEGTPNVVLEAQACGLPVVASRVGGVPTLVGERSGILVNPQDPDALAAALDQALRRAWGREEIASSAGLQGWDKIAGRYLDVAANIVRK